jgi:hypothetical protein
MAPSGAVARALFPKLGQMTTSAEIIGCLNRR